MTPFRSLCLVLATALVAAVASPAAAQEIEWLRYPAISPDGERIAFSYQGDLWVVPSTGGEARRLTTHAQYERSPVWSPDGTRIAFASDRHGQFDVFVMPSEGGRAERLTFHSAGDEPSAFTRDGSGVLFSSRRQDAPHVFIGSGFLSELYVIPVAGGRPHQILTTPAELAQPSPVGGRIAYQDLKGYENPWRKHHTSAVTRDVWVHDPADGSHIKVSDFAGEDRNPVWAPNGSALYYLSERGGNFNVWRHALGNGEPEQVTRHETHPVRFLSASADATLCYAWDGGIWTKAPDADPKRLTVTARPDDRQNPARIETLRDGATEMAVSPEEDEVAFVVRGEVFVASVEHGTTKRITSTPEQERSVTWAADGRTLYYASERGGTWNVYASTIAREDEKRFFESTLLTERAVIEGPEETFQPLASPDGKFLAYLSDRDEIRVLDLAANTSRTLVPKERNYSYADGDISFRWSPDSKWICFTYIAGQRWVDDVGAVSLAGGELINVSQSGYSEGNPRWSPDSRALLFSSARFGRRNHGSWGSDSDVMALYLTRASWDRAQLSREDYDRLVEAEKKADKKDRKGKGDEQAWPDDDDRKPPEPVAFESDGREHRVRRLTMHSEPIGDYALSPDGEALVYLAQVDGKWDLWLCRVRDRETRKLLVLGDDRAGSVEFSHDGKSLFLLRSKGRLAKVDVGGSLGEDGGPAKPKPIGYAAEMTIDSPEERAYLYEHAWRQAREKFYDPQLHGVDWDAMKAAYARFLPHVTTNHDFAELLSELLGELNASHTGSGYRLRSDQADKTASLGLLYDVDDAGDGLKVAEVIARGPADKAASKIVPGVTITQIDGAALDAGRNWAPLLNHKEGKRVRVAVRGADGTTWEEVLRPISGGAENNLLYERWVRRCRERTHALSGGRVGYVHVRGMNDASFRRVYRDALGLEGDREALLVDTRFNGGGWLHDQLVTFLDGRDYLWFTPRGKRRGDLGTEPFAKWTRPVCVVMSESNYSDAHLFPFAFKELGVGQLVGTPVAGTGTAVWWETLIDPTLYFGIPQVGMVTEDGSYLENQELQPDVLVYNDPESVARGEDAQLAKAVEVLLAELDDK